MSLRQPTYWLAYLAEATETGPAEITAIAPDDPRPAAVHPRRPGRCSPQPTSTTTSIRTSGSCSLPRSPAGSD